MTFLGSGTLAPHVFIFYRQIPSKKLTTKAQLIFPFVCVGNRFIFFLMRWVYYLHNPWRICILQQPSVKPLLRKIEIEIFLIHRHNNRLKYGCRLLVVIASCYPNRDRRLFQLEFHSVQAHCCDKTDLALSAFETYRPNHCELQLSFPLSGIVSRDMARPSRALTVEEVCKEFNVSDSFEALLH